MEDDKKIFVIVFVVILVALAGIGVYLSTQQPQTDVSHNNTSDNKTNDTNKTVMIDKDGKNNNTVVGFNASKMGNNTTHRVYNPQTDSYVTVIGEGYDSEVNRWYTYDTDGVRYYNTRFK